MQTLLAASLALCATGFGSLALAQGTVRFDNSSGGLVFQFMDATGSSYMAVPNAQGFVQLAYAPTATAYSPYTPGQTSTAWIAANPGWTLGPIGLIGPEAGRFDGGIVTLAGVAAGTDADYVVLGWTGTLPTFDAALEGSFQVGVVGAFQQVFTTRTGGLDPLVDPPSISSTFSGGIIGVQVPEPSAVSLAALGALILFLHGRRCPPLQGSLLTTGAARSQTPPGKHNTHQDPCSNYAPLLLVAAGRDPGRGSRHLARSR